MTDDTISRQDAVSRFSDLLMIELRGERLPTWEEVYNAIKELPSAQRKGKWIMHIDDLFPVESTKECSKCHHEQSLIIDDNFCPNCGAEMKGEEDECNTNDNTGN